MGFKIPGVGNAKEFFDKAKDAIKKDKDTSDQETPSQETSPAPTPQETVSQDQATTNSPTTENTSDKKQSKLFVSINEEIHKAHKMLQTNGKHMQKQMGFDYDGATAKSSPGGETLTLGESIVLMGQFAGKLQDEGYLKYRGFNKNDAHKTNVKSIVQDILGDEKHLLNKLTSQEQDAMCTFISADQMSRDRIMRPASQNQEVQKLREFPKGDKLTHLYVPASEGRDAQIFTLGGDVSNKSTEYNAHMEVSEDVFLNPETQDLG